MTKARKISGVSRAFTHQLVRHRAGMAFSQLSQQYHTEDNAQFVEPWGLSTFPEALKLWKAQVHSSLQTYQAIERTLNSSSFPVGPKLSPKEQNRLLRSTARSVLPNATETKIVMTANARSLRHFLKIRGSIPGDPEMRLISAKLLEHLKKEAPAAFFDFELKTLTDGSPEVFHHPSCV
jgi:thymidylate synthase (FAD)